MFKTENTPITKAESKYKMTVLNVIPYCDSIALSSKVNQKTSTTKGWTKKVNSKAMLSVII
jgi:hypothetical protein